MACQLRTLSVLAKDPYSVPASMLQPPVILVPGEEFQEEASGLLVSAHMCIYLYAEKHLHII